MFLGIAYVLGNVFNDIRGETSACAQDGHFVFMKENLELKSHYVLSLIRMLQGQHVLISSQN